MLLDDMVDYLSSAGTTSDGTAIFAGILPDAPDIAVAVYETGGTSPTYAMNALPGQAVVENPRIQVVCRNVKDDYATARRKAQDIFLLLDGLPSRTINGTSYKWGSAVQSPFLMRRDELGRCVIAQNFDIVKAMSA